LRTGPSSKETWLLSLLAAGPIVVFTAAALFAKGLPHWSMPGWLFTFPLLGNFITNFKAHRTVIAIGTLGATVFTFLLMVAFVGQANVGWFTNDLSLRVRAADPTLDLLSWREVRIAIRRRHLIDSLTPAIAGSRWMDAAKLNYEMGTTTPVLCLCDDPQQFRFLHSPANYFGRNVIIIQTKEQFDKHGPIFARWFDKVKSLSPIMLHRGGNDALELFVFRGIKLKQGPEGYSDRTNSHGRTTSGPQ